MRIFFSILSILFVLIGFAQKKYPTIKNGIQYDKALIDPTLDSLHTENDFVLTFKIRSYWSGSRPTDYFILTKKGEKLSAYRYVVQRWNHIIPVLLSQSDLNDTWNTYISNGLFEIKNERDLEDKCPIDSLTGRQKDIYVKRMTVSDSYTYEFQLLSKNKIKILSYYDPESFLRFCKNVVERDKVIEAAKFLKNLASQ